MVDIFDRAAELEQREREAAIAKARAGSRASLPSLASCKDCDICIEPARQALGGVTRCAECQGFYQQEQHQKGFTV